MDTNYYMPIYEWERDRIQENPGENPYNTHYLLHTKHGELETLFRKVQYGYPLYPPVDSEFITARRLALEKGKVSANWSTAYRVVYVKPEEEMTPSRLQYMQQLTDRFLYAEDYGQLDPEPQNTAFQTPTWEDQRVWNEKAERWNTVQHVRRGHRRLALAMSQHPRSALSGLHTLPPDVLLDIANGAL
jgi:hypothetical protein